MRAFHSISITDDASIGAARRGVHAFASGIGFDERERAELDIVVQEIGTNAVRYATLVRGGIAGGEAAICWSTIDDAIDDESSAATEDAEAVRRKCKSPHTQCGIELFYTDRGPGIFDVAQALRDSVSSGGGLGGGFGAIRRLTDEFYIYSTVRRTERLTLSGVRRSTHGTAILCRKRTGGIAATNGATTKPDNVPKEMVIGARSRPYAGETFNGDGYYVRHMDGSTLLAVVDGLGHGTGALAATRVALDALDGWTNEPLDELMYAAHDALRATRGAVMSVALLDHNREQLHFSGVGNVSTRVFNAPVPVHPLSINGTLGTRLAKVPVWQYPWREGATIIMASDGLSASWDMNAYPGLLEQPPQLIAGVLLRDYGRTSDDATVLVAS